MSDNSKVQVALDKAAQQDVEDIMLMMSRHTAQQQNLILGQVLMELISKRTRAWEEAKEVETRSNAIMVELADRSQELRKMLTSLSEQ